MKYFADGSFLKDVKEFFEDAINIANYLDDFKKNQVEYFDDYLAEREGIIEAKEERKREEETIAILTMPCYI